MSERPRTHGFRCSPLDAAVVIAAPIATWLARPVLGPMAGVICLAVGHFFLFCNVFRITRRKELLWTAACLANVTAWTLADAFSWAGILAVQTPLTAMLIGLELRSPGYHGVLARRLNPRLDDYLAGRPARANTDGPQPPPR
jgi:hypothetical protein